MPFDGMIEVVGDGRNLYFSLDKVEEEVVDIERPEMTVELCWQHLMVAMGGVDGSVEHHLMHVGGGGGGE